MADGRNIHGRVVMDVTADTTGLRAEVDRKLAKAFDLNVNLKLPSRTAMQAELDAKTGAGLKLKIASLDLPSKTAMQKQLDTKTGTGLKLFIDELNMPSKKEIQAQLDAKTGRDTNGLKLFIDELDMPSKKEVQAQLDAKTGRDTNGLRLFIDELDMPGKQEIQAQLDAKTGRDTKGLVLFVDELNLPSKKEIQAQLDHVTGRDTTGLKLFIDELNMPSKPEMQAQLDSRVGERGLRLRVYIDINNKSFIPVILAQKAAQEAITQNEAKELLKRQTFRENLEQRFYVASKLREEKLEGDRLLIRERTDARLNVLEEQNLYRSERAQESAALRREIIQENLNARLKAAQDAFDKRRQLALEAEQRRLEARARKPILQTVLINGSRLASSLTDFDRTVTRVLRTSLLAFGAWSIGVEAAVGIAAAAAIASFKEVELAATETASVIAAQTIADEITQNGKAISDFSGIVTDSFDRIIVKADEVALTTLFDTGDIIGGIDAAVRAGQDLEGALASASAAANFAQVNQLEAADASERLAAGLAAAGLEADQSAQLIDKISFTAASSLGEANDYLEAFANRAAASAQAFGYTNDEVLVFLSLLGQTGTLGREAGTQANIVFRELGRAAGRAADAWKKYGIDANAPLAEQLVAISAVVEETRRLRGRAGVAGLAKELGLTYRSISSILQVLPKVNALGLEGLNNLERGIQNSTGLVDKQAEQVRKTIAFQWDNLLNSVSITSRRFAKRLQPELSEFFDAFGGQGGLIDQSAEALERFGDRFAATIDNVTRYVQSPAFISGIKTLVDAIRITLRGVSDAFTAFAAQFGSDSEKSRSTFETLADSVRAFAQLSARVLPVVARILGQIFNFLIDNADAFETFAKLTLAVYAARKAWTLFAAPVLASAQALTLARDAMIAWGATETIGPVKSALVLLATRLGVVTTSATAATVAVEALTAAELQLATASVTAGNASLGAALLDPLLGRQAKGLFGSRQVREKLRRQRTEGVEELLIGERIAESNRLRRQRNLFNNRVDARDFVRQRGAVQGVEFLDPRLAREQQRGLFGASQVGEQLRGQRAAGVAELGRIPRGAEVAKLSSRSGPLAKLGALFARILPTIEKFSPALARLVGGFARFAGPIGLVVAAIDFGIGVFKGFFDEIERGSKSGTDLGNTLAELEPIFDAIFEAAKVTFAVLTDVLAIAGRIGASFGRVIGTVFNDALINLGDFVRGFKLLFEGDLIGALKAFGDIIVNTITLPFRAAISFVIDLVADAIESFARIPIIGDKVKGVSDALRGAADATRDFRLNLSEAAQAAENVGSGTFSATTAFNDLASSIDGASRSIKDTVENRTQQAANALDRFIDRLVATNERARALYAEQVGLTARSAALERVPEFLRDLDLIQEQADKIGDAAEKKYLAGFERRARRLERARRQALNGDGSGGDGSGSGGGGGGGSARASFVDPDEAIAAQIAALRPQQRAAEASAAIAKALKGGEEGYKATRREVALLEDALPGLDRAIENQRTEVERLDGALQALRDTQLEGTQAFSDQLFALDQQQKALELQRLDLLIAGTGEEDPAIVALDEQLAALQQQAERTSLVESLQLDPLRRQLEQTFNPTTEASFKAIVDQFKQLSEQRAAANLTLEQQQATQLAVNATLEQSKAAYDRIDEAARRATESIASATSASTSAGAALQTTGDQAAGAARNVRRYNDAVNDAPDARGLVDRALDQAGKRVNERAGDFQNVGRQIVANVTAGMVIGAQTILYPKLTEIVGTSVTYLRGAIAPARRIGELIMDSFLDGLKSGFGSPEKEGSVAWYLNVYIPEWIRQNKGPLAYDATILVPAGQAVMEGFGRGLREGFGQVKSFVSEIGPSLSEYVTGDEFSGRTATFMADIAVGKTPNIDDLFGDLRFNAAGDVFPGAVDPSLGFLHPTLSLADTTRMAFGIVKALGGGLNTGGPGQISRPDGTKTASNNVSAHTFGTAADIGTGGPRPTEASLRLFEQAKKLLGTVFRQIIHNGIGLNAGGGSFPDSQHYDHVHLEFIRGMGFDESSGKIGMPLVTDIPGASDAVDRAISNASRKHNVELALLAAVAKAESGFRVNAGSSAGARGLFQFIQSTGRGFGITNFDDPNQSADAGARYLKNLLGMFNGNLSLALAGYNAGPGAVQQYGGIPPFSETQAYVPRVLKFLQEFRRMFGGFRETGGPVQAGKAYVVGERRAELFVPNRSGRIMPDTSAIGSGMTYQDNRQITVTTAATDPELTADLVDARTRTRFTGVNFR